MKSTCLLLVEIFLFEIVIIYGDSIDPVPGSKDISGSTETTVKETISKVVDAIQIENDDQKTRIMKLLNEELGQQLILEAEKKSFSTIRHCFKTFKTAIDLLVEHLKNAEVKMKDLLIDFKKDTLDCIRRASIVKILPLERRGYLACRVRKVVTTTFTNAIAGIQNNNLKKAIGTVLYVHLSEKIIDEASRKQDFALFEECFTDSEKNVKKIIEYKKGNLLNCLSRDAVPDCVKNEIKPLLTEMRNITVNCISPESEILLPENPELTLLQLLVEDFGITNNDLINKIRSKLLTCLTNPMRNEAKNKLFFTTIQVCFDDVKQQVQNIIHDVKKSYDTCSTGETQATCMNSAEDELNNKLTPLGESKVNCIKGGL